MTQSQNSTQQQPLPLVVGIDWADSKHDVCVHMPLGVDKSFEIGGDTDDVEKLVRKLTELADERMIEIRIEKSRVRIVQQLMFRDGVCLYLVDPKQIARYRESFTSSGGKNDASDASLLCRFLRERRDSLKPFQPNDRSTRIIDELSRTRRKLVDERTRLRQQLQSTLKTYYPLALTLARGNASSLLLLAIVQRWPDPRSLKRAKPNTVKRFFQCHGIKNEERVNKLLADIRDKPPATRDEGVLLSLSIQASVLVRQIKAINKAIIELEEKLDDEVKKHPDAKLFQALPGAGAALAPRLAAAMGSDRDRFDSAEEVMVVSGIAPVTKQSGKTKLVKRRRACNKYLKQTFHEFANCAKQWRPWSRAYYQWQREKGVAHQAAVRKLASRWIRILFKVWKTKTKYDPHRYIQAMKSKNHPLLKYLQQNEN